MSKLSRALSLSALLAVSACAQTSTGTASSSGTCSLANSGKIQAVRIDCGIGREQGQTIIDILNKILAHQQEVPLSELNRKLDAILQNTNPNATKILYQCGGTWLSSGPTSDSLISVNGGGSTAEFDELAKLLNTSNFSTLDLRATNDLTQTPGWLTPLLFKAIAKVEERDLPAAMILRDTFTRSAGEMYNDSHCSHLLDMLNRALSQVSPATPGQ